jgi:tight adherence protein B
VNNPPLLLTLVCLLMFVSVAMAVRYGWPTLSRWLGRTERWYDQALNQHLLLEIPARSAMWLSLMGVLICALIAYWLMGLWFWFVIGGVIGGFLPLAVIRHLESKRRAKLESQLIDGITTLASGVRAGLNLIQSMELLVRNGQGPIKQEIAQLLREYQMGLDFNHAMRNAANRIGSRNYRLLFTAIEMHRVRGGDAGESLDRIAESIRDIQRLEGKLDAITAQGRSQAWMMALAPFGLLLILYGIDAQGVTYLFTDNLGRVMLLVAFGLILGAFLWIRNIMAVDI